jgi:predicted DNA-binding protein with PD1-like motif
VPRGEGGSNGRSHDTMKSKKLTDGPERSFALVLESGEEAMACLKRFAADERLDAAHFTAIGAFQDAVLGFYELERKAYRRNPVREQVEVVSLVGDVTGGEKAGDPPTVHAHVVVGRADGTALGGHLMEAHVRPTLEIVITETPAHLRRRKDAASGLALIDP